MTEPGRTSSCAVRFRVAVTLGSAFGTVELSDRVGAHFRDPLPDAVALVFPGPHGSLHHHVRARRQCPRVFGQLAEGDDPVPVRAALPVSIGILPGFLRDNRKGYDESAV